MNIDLASQKLTVVSTAEPEAIVKAIKKARKIATICSPAEPAGEATGGVAEPAAPPPPPPVEPPANQPPVEAETPPKEEAPPSQGQDDGAKAAAPAVTKPSPEAKEAVPGEPKEVAEIIPVVHHYPYDRASNYYYYNDHYYPYPRRYEPPDYAYSGYSHYRTSPYALPQRVRFIQDAVAGDDYSYVGNYRRGGGGEVCVFSEENPNACTIV